MLYDVVVNDWNETTYVPTTFGNVLMAAAIIILLASAVAFARKCAKKPPADSPETPADSRTSSTRLTVKQLAFCAMAIALGTVLSEIKLFHLPYGGSVTLLSMLAVCLPGYFFGLGAGLLTGIAYGILQLLIDPYILFPMQLVVDYLLAFGAMGLSGLFSSAKHGLIKGYIAAILGRYVFVVISGCLFFSAYAWEGWAPLPYSLVYNASYIFPEAAVTVLILAIPAVSKGLSRIRAMTLS